MIAVNIRCKTIYPATEQNKSLYEIYTTNETWDKSPCICGSMVAEQESPDKYMKMHRNRTRVSVTDNGSMYVVPMKLRTVHRHCKSQRGHSPLRYHDKLLNRNIYFTVDV